MTHPLQRFTDAELVRAIEAARAPASHPELAKLFGVRCNAVSERVAKLEARGAVRRLPRSPRTLRAAVPRFEREGTGYLVFYGSVLVAEFVDFTDHRGTL